MIKIHLNLSHQDLFLTILKFEDYYVSDIVDYSKFTLRQKQKIIRINIFDHSYPVKIFIKKIMEKKREN